MQVASESETMRFRMKVKKRKTRERTFIELVFPERLTIHDQGQEQSFHDRYMQLTSSFPVLSFQYSPIHSSNLFSPFACSICVMFFTSLALEQY